MVKKTKTDIKLKEKPKKKNRLPKKPKKSHKIKSYTKNKGVINNIYNVLFAIISSFLLLILLAFSYFLILISIQPTSFPLINDQIESYINSNLSWEKQIKIQDAYISMESLSRIKINLRKTRFTVNNKRDISLPIIEIKFPIIRLLSINYAPSHIKIIEPVIDINSQKEAKKTKIAINGFAYEDLTSNYSQKLWEIFQTLEKKIYIKSFQIENAKINFIDEEKTSSVLIKNLGVRVKVKSGNLSLAITNKINFGNGNLSQDIVGNCQFQKNKELKCDLGVFNMDPEDWVGLYPDLKILANINSRLSGNVNLEIDSDRNLSNLLFNFNAEKGNFHFTEILPEKMDFQNFIVSGEFNNSLSMLNIYNFAADFDDSKLQMSAMINNIDNDQNQNINLQIKLNNVPTDDLGRFWPTFLDKNGIKSWLVEHLEKGIINDAYAKISLKTENQTTTLDNIQSELVFSDVNLKYAEHFPAITKISGIAAFDEQGMKIDLVSGSVLNSKIKASQVAIDNFHAPEIILKISGIAEGDSGDLLKHIDYKSDNLTQEINNYLKGQAQSIFDIRLPISDNLDLYNSYIRVQSEIKNYYNQYLLSGESLLASTIKKFNSNDFVSEINLSNAKIELSKFGISKKQNEESYVKTVLSFDHNDRIDLKNFEWNIGKNNILGDISIYTEPFTITKLKVKNNNIGRNNFTLNYKADTDKLSRIIKISGKELNLAPIIENNIANDHMNIEEKPYLENIIDINLKKVHLMNKEDLDNIDINFNCIISLCKNSFIKSGPDKDPTISINFDQKRKKDTETIFKGEIENIALLARGFDISDKILSAGVTKINGKIAADNKKIIIDGKLKINSGFSVLRSEIVETVAQDKIFDQNKKDLLGKNKLDFKKLELKFQLKDQTLNINDLIASGSPLGFTARGSIDLTNSNTNFKGLIVPDYSLNKLFGIGNLPIIRSIVIGEKGGGIFAMRYQYNKNQKIPEGKFKTNPASAIVPGGARNIFDLF